MKWPEPVQRVAAVAEQAAAEAGGLPRRTPTAVDLAVGCKLGEIVE